MLFVNLVEFDMLWGHRRDSHGYAQALRDVDNWFAQVQQAMRPDDVIFFTADHGVDPTYRGTDHTRECVPLLAYGQHLRSGSQSWNAFNIRGPRSNASTGVWRRVIAAGTSFAQDLGLS